VLDEYVQYFSPPITALSAKRATILTKRVAPPSTTLCHPVLGYAIRLIDKPAASAENGDLKFEEKEDQHTLKRVRVT
jgi:hypothetical protein